MSLVSAPKITIITAVKNDVRGLGVTAKSVLSQNSKDFEWLIVDGQSNDGSFELANTYLQLDKVRVISAPPKGIYNAMNTGVREAAGAWIWFINAGDFLLTNSSVTEVVSEICANRLDHAFASPVIHFTKSGFIYDLSIPKVYGIRDYIVANLNHQGVLVTKKVFYSVGAFDENLRFAADGKFLDKVASEGDFFLSKKFYVGFAMGGTASRFFRKTLKETNSYRPRGDSRFKALSFILKDKLRRTLLSLEQMKVVRVPIHWYLALRQQNIIGLYPGLID